MGTWTASILFAFILGSATAYAESEAAAAMPAADLPASLPAGLPATAPDLAPEGIRLDARKTPVASAYREHIPLAFFSLGSLAMGGVIWGIHSNLDNSTRGAASGDGTKVNMAMGAAGLTALAAGAAYLYYASRGARKPRWDGSVSGGVAPDGSVAASLTVPLSSLMD